jgi:hypothetical protein
MDPGQIAPARIRSIAPVIRSALAASPQRRHSPTHMNAPRLRRGAQANARRFRGRRRIQAVLFDVERKVRIRRADETSHEDDLAFECLRIGDCQELKAWATRVGELCSAGSGSKFGIRARKQAEIGASRIVRERDLQNSIRLGFDWNP